MFLLVVFVVCGGSISLFGKGGKGDATAVDDLMGVVVQELDEERGGDQALLAKLPPVEIIIKKAGPERIKQFWSKLKEYRFPLKFI